MGILGSILEKFFGNKHTRDITLIAPLVQETNSLFDEIKLLSHDDFRSRSVQMRERVLQFVAAENQEIDQLKSEAELSDDAAHKEDLYDRIDKIEKDITEKFNEVLRDFLPEAFAIVKDTARRFCENEAIEVVANDFDKQLATTKDFITIENGKAIYHNKWTSGGNLLRWEMIHYDEQLIGGIVLHEGKVAEMATGEGKTLVATLPVFLNALTGRGVHIVTVNDYLSKRDSEWMGPIYQFHGLSVDCIDRYAPNSDERRKAYNCDITFGTNNEFGFDYLRDNMAINPVDLVQRPHNFAIVDEVDSVLIDDARTPLIISGAVSKDPENQKFEELRPKVEVLFAAQKNLVNQALTEAKKLIAENNTEKGGMLLLRAYKGLPKNKSMIKFLSEQGNKVLMHKTENFYMAENNKNMHLVTDDLYFVIDEKQHSVDLTDKGIDSITNKSDDPAFFVLPDIGSSIADIEKSGLSASEKAIKKDELIQEYGIKSDRVHTISQLLKAYALYEKDTEYVLIENKVKIVDEQTGRVMEGRRYSDGLHQAIEAKERVKVEAATQTMATVTLQNYFRMYKKLAGMTGTAETEAGELWNIYKLDVVVIPTHRVMVRKDEEDLVYKTKREKYSAVIDEIAALISAGRPVLVGTTSVEISELLSRMLKLRNIKHNVLNAKLHQREAEIVAEAGKSGTVTIATNMAGRGTDIKLSQQVRDAGGLAIIGTERHESRRVDRQLRGRAGRQGDPGTSQFYVSLEDDLMRLFGSDRIASIMDRLGLKEGEVIQHSMISKSIERAQTKVEENNFGIRKRLLEYDDVMNSQREVIYTKRRHALYGERVSVDITNMMNDVCESVINDLHGSVDYETFTIELLRHLAVEPPFSHQDYNKLSTEELQGILFVAVAESYKRKMEAISHKATSFLDSFMKSNQQYENVIYPFTDGMRMYQVIVNLKRAHESRGLEIIRAIEKAIVLISIDDAWKEHLREMDELRTSVQNASYEQKDPLLIYKLESFDLFRGMLDRINKEVTGILMKGHIPVKGAADVKEATPPRRLDLSKFTASKRDVAPSAPIQSQNGMPDTRPQQATAPIRVEKQTGRNETCPCGSGKKFKNCHGK